MPCLRIKIPGRAEETHSVSGDRVTIGRRPENTIQILDPSVSGFHAELIATHGHYRLRDLQATNRCLVGGQEIAEYHLRERCHVSFGSVECDYDPAGDAGTIETALSPARMEQDLVFLRSENAELRERIRTLERRIDILGSAQLFSDRRNQKHASPAMDRDHTATIEAELENTREELAIALRARDAARAAAGILHSEKTSILREIRASEIQPTPWTPADSLARETQQRPS